MTDTQRLTPDTQYPCILPAGDAAALIVLGDEMSAEMSLRIQTLGRSIEAAAIPGVVDLLPAYCTLLVHFDPETASLDSIRQPIQRLLGAGPAAGGVEPRLRDIPTVYGGEYGPDLPVVAAKLGLSEDEVVRRHSSATYFVCFLGFAPGHPYVVGLPPELALPRRTTPRELVPGGAVTIANQSNIYGVPNPTGWWWIGRTPLRMFDPTIDPPTYLLPGDQLRYVPITGEEFRELSE